MNPLLRTALEVLVVFALGVACAWTLQDWRYGKQIADMTAKHDNELNQQAQAAIKDLTDGIKVIRDAADKNAVTSDKLNASVSGIVKDFKNVQAKVPLAVGCKPDLGRMRALSAAVDAANKANTGPIAGPAVPASGSP